MARLAGPRGGPPARWVRAAGPSLVAGAAYLALALFALRPIWRELGRAITPDAGDPLFVLCILKWGVHQLHQGFPDFWNATFFHPTRRVTAFSDHLWGPAVVLAAFEAVWPNAVAGFDVLLLAAFVLTGWTTFHVFRRQGLPALPAFLGGAMWTFSPFRWGHLSHPQLLLAALVPLVLWRFDRLLENVTWRRAGLFLLVYGLHLSGSSYLAYMIHFPLAALLVGRLAGPERRRLRGAGPVLLATALVAAGLAAAAFLPYLAASRAQGLARHAVEMRAYGATALSFLTPASYNWYSAFWPAALTRAENSLFAGFLPTALILAAAVLGWRRYGDAVRLGLARRSALLALLGVALLGYLAGDAETWSASPTLAGSTFHLAHRGYGGPVLLLAIGLGGALLLFRRSTGRWPFPLRALAPWDRGMLLMGATCFLLAHPLVYVPLARFVPGMNGMRVPARFNAFVSFAVAWFAARAAAALLARIAGIPRRRLAAGVLTAGLLVELQPRALPWQPLPRERDLPAVYHWLAARQDVAAVLELPLKDNSTDLRFMYAWTFHWKPLVNGYSGYIPEDYKTLFGRCCNPLPEGEDLAWLRAHGVTHVVLHEWGLRGLWEQKAARRWAAFEPGVELVYLDSDVRVFRILPVLQ